MPTPYSPSGTYPTFPLELVDDGEVYEFDSIQKSNNPAKGLFAKLIDGVGYLKNKLDGTASGQLASQVVSDGTTLIGFSGYPALSVPAMMLRGLLELILDHDASQDTKIELNNNTSALADANAMAPTLNTAYFNTTVLTAARTYTLPIASAPIPTTGDVIEFHGRQAGAALYADIVNEGGAGYIVRVADTTFGGARMRFDGAKWRLQHAYGTYTIGTDA